MKKESESDTRARYISPALREKGWDFIKHISCEYQITDGKIVVKGNEATRDESAKGKRKIADYLLCYPSSSNPLAVIEAKKSALNLAAGIQQAKEYARLLDLPYAYASNGKGFLEYEASSGRERELALGDFPSPKELYDKCSRDLNDEAKELIKAPFAQDLQKQPRYYQVLAINAALKAIAKGSKRLLLVMATGTGKTFTAYHIIERLLRQKRVKKVLFVADRNSLIDQSLANDFAPFKNKMCKIEKGVIDTAFSVYLGLYQQLCGEDGEGQKGFTQVSPDFFDLIVIDECHRGSAKESSSYRELLEYFSCAIQLGLTATPKGGVTFPQMRTLIQGLVKKGRVVGMDIVEICPEKDTVTNISSITAGRLICNLIGKAVQANYFNK